MAEAALDNLPSGVKLLLRHLHSLVPEKLEETNYASWKISVHNALDANCLLGYVDGSIVAPAATIADTEKPDTSVSNPAFARWRVVDAQIKACLLAVVSTTVQKHVRGCSSSSELWNSLATRYASLSHSHIFQLRDRLHTLKKGSRTMAQYLDEVSTIVTALDTVNEIIPEKDLVQCVIRGLPSEYASLKQAVRMNPEPVTLQVLSSWLNSEELNVEFDTKMSLQDSAPAEPSTALTAQRGGRLGSTATHRGSNQRGRFAGQNRGSRPNSTHFRSPSGEGGRSPSNEQRRDLPVCQICDKRGHAARNCWYRYENTSSGLSNSRSQANHASHNQHHDSEWLLDTGANTHVTSDFSQLCSPSRYSGNDNITVGSGQTLPIAHTGTGQIYTHSDSGQHYQAGEIQGPL